MDFKNMLDLWDADLHRYMYVYRDIDRYTYLYIYTYRPVVPSSTSKSPAVMHSLSRQTSSGIPDSQSHDAPKTPAPPPLTQPFGLDPDGRPPGVLAKVSDSAQGTVAEAI